jgi:hypothetical protein
MITRLLWSLKLQHSPRLLRPSSSNVFSCGVPVSRHQMASGSLGTVSPTLSLPFRCNKVDAGHWSRSRVYDGLLRSVLVNAVAAFFCCCISLLLLTLKRQWGMRVDHMF